MASRRFVVLFLPEPDPSEFDAFAYRKLTLAALPRNANEGTWSTFAASCADDRFGLEVGLRRNPHNLA